MDGPPSGCGQPNGRLSYSILGDDRPIERETISIEEHDVIGMMERRIREIVTEFIEIVIMARPITLLGDREILEASKIVIDEPTGPRHVHYLRSVPIKGTRVRYTLDLERREHSGTMSPYRSIRGGTIERTIPTGREGHQ